MFRAASRSRMKTTPFVRDPIHSAGDHGPTLIHTDLGMGLPIKGNML